MDDFSKDPRSEDDAVGQDAGVLVGLLEKMRQERDLLVHEERPVEGQVLAPAWGRWPW